MKLTIHPLDQNQQHVTNAASLDSASLAVNLIAAKYR